MDHKYVKYKSKYLKLKQLGGGMKQIKINMSPYIDFFKKCVNELDCEISFTISLENDNIICDFYKGNNMFPDEQIGIDQPLFNKSYTFGYIAGHTHDRYSKERLDYKYSAPSPRDYTTMIEQFYKYHIKYHYIFTVDGIYKLTLNDLLIDIIKSCFPEMIFTFFIISRRYNVFNQTPAYNVFIETLTFLLNDMHFILEKPHRLKDNIEGMLDDYKKYIETIQILPDKAREYLMNILTKHQHIDTIKDLKSYIKFINTIGFNLELLPWDDFTISGNIDINVYNFIHSSITARKENTLVDLLYINEHIEKDYNDHINNNLSNNNFISLNKTDLNKLFETIKITNYGEIITLDI
jgi:hypothetical protein